MKRTLQIRLSEELLAWIESDTEELDVAVGVFVEAMLRAAYKKIGAGEGLRLGIEGMPFSPSRRPRPTLPWRVTKTVPHRGQMVPDEFRLGKYRMVHKGERQMGGVCSQRPEPREPHGRNDQVLDGWYLVGSNLPSQFVWLGTRTSEAKRESGTWMR